MKIIKKDGQIEEFSLSKLQTSLENSAVDAGLILTYSDLNQLSHEILKRVYKINTNDIISTYCLTGIVVDVLKDLNFRKFIFCYLNI